MKDLGLLDDPGPEEKTSWRTFIRSHWESMAACDFFTISGGFRRSKRWTMGHEFDTACSQAEAIKRGLAGDYSYVLLDIEIPARSWTVIESEGLNGPPKAGLRRTACDRCPTASTYVQIGWGRGGVYFAGFIRAPTGEFP